MEYPRAVPEVSTHRVRTITLQADGVMYRVPGAVRVLWPVLAPVN
ncbi:hypothetical protein OH805_30480 [Streptomyces sp. NBC_00879]|nr:hypothetical protein OH805_30480 [Streptomyces sp. NBC_00879]